MSRKVEIHEGDEVTFIHDKVRLDLGEVRLTSYTQEARHAYMRGRYEPIYLGADVTVICSGGRGNTLRATWYEDFDDTKEVVRLRAEVARLNAQRRRARRLLKRP